MTITSKSDRDRIRQRTAEKRGAEYLRYKARIGDRIAARQAAREEAAALLGSVPADTRSLTARVLGDPLPGRSALDRRSLPYVSIQEGR